MSMLKFAVFALGNYLTLCRFDELLSHSRSGILGQVLYLCDKNSGININDKLFAINKLQCDKLYLQCELRNERNIHFKYFKFIVKNM